MVVCLVGSISGDCSTWLGGLTGFCSSIGCCGCSAGGGGLACPAESIGCLLLGGRGYSHSYTRYTQRATCSHVLMADVNQEVGEGSARKCEECGSEGGCVEWVSARRAMIVQALQE
eukprot:45193-Hanusia_phi.AAC.4